MLNFDFLEKGLGIVAPPHFVYDFNKNVSYVTFYLLIKFHCLVLPLLLLQLFVNQVVTS